MTCGIYFKLLRAVGVSGMVASKAAFQITQRRKGSKKRLGMC